MFDCACCSVAKYPGNPCLGHRPVKYGKAHPYEWLSYAEVGERVDAIAGAMAALGLKAHGRVGVYGVNSPEWMMAMQARPPAAAPVHIHMRSATGPAPCA